MFSSDVIWFFAGLFIGGGVAALIMSIMFVAGQDKDLYHD